MKRLIKSKFFKNFLALFTGTALSQIIPVLASFFLTRLYSEYDFGALDVFLKIQSFLVVIATLRYDLSIPLPKQEKHAFNLFNFSLKFNFIFLLICQVISILLYLCNHILLWGFNNFWIYLFLPLTVFFIALNHQFNYWFVRKNWYKNVSIAFITNSLINNGLKILFGLIKSSFVGLIFSNILGAISASLTYFFKFKKHKSKYSQYVSKKQQTVLVKKYKNFPLITLPHSLTDMTRDLIFVALLSSFYGLKTLGAFAFTIRILKTPILFIGMALGQVFFQKISNRVANNLPIYKRTVNMILQLFSIAIIPFIIIGIWGEEIFSFLFTDKWINSGKYATIMSPWLLINFIVSPLTLIPAILKKQKPFFIFGIIISAIYLASLFIPNMFFKIKDFYSTLFWVSMCQIIGLIFIIFWTLHITKKYDHNLSVNKKEKILDNLKN